MIKINMNKKTKDTLFRKMTLVFLGGLSNGLPGVLTWQTLNIWLSQQGHSKTVIGLMFFAGMPYTFKFLFSPLVDRYSLPILTPFFGQRRSWAILMQTLMFVCLLAIGYGAGQYSLSYTAFFCFLTSLFSSLNQIATVAHRIEILNEQEAPHGVAIGIVGYRVGKLLGRAGALYLLSFLSWETIYYLLSSTLFLSLLFYAYQPFDDQIYQAPVRNDKLLLKFYQKKYPYLLSHNLLKNLFSVLIVPFIYFKRRTPHWKPILSLLLLINIGDDLTIGMIDLFYLELGFSTIDIATITKVFGLICSLLGGFWAAQLAQRFSILRCLGWATILHALSLLILLALSLKGPHLKLLILSVTTEYFTSGMKAALLAMYISNLCSKVQHTGTHYAFFSSVKAIPLLISSSLSGWLIQSVSWPIFFSISFIVSIPGAICALSLKSQTELPKSSDKFINMLRLGKAISTL